MSVRERVAAFNRGGAEGFVPRPQPLQQSRSSVQPPLPRNTNLNLPQRAAAGAGVSSRAAVEERNRNYSPRVVATPSAPRSSQPEQSADCCARNNSGSGETYRDVIQLMKEQHEEHVAAIRRLEQYLSRAPQQQRSTYEHALLCPISYEIMADPVICSDGHTYDRDNIQQWLEFHDTSPLTNQRLASRNLIPNHALRGIIRDHLGANSYAM